MLVLLPPSEGKTPPRRGRPLDLAALAHPELTAHREALLDALDPGLRSAPTARASAIYTGVLYQRLRLPELPLRARRRVLIASALWGMLRPDDRIPAYKLSISARLPRVGGLAAYWRPALSKALPASGLVVDLRSGGYAAAWRPAGAEIVDVRAFTELPDGRRAPVSHMVKSTRGMVARLLLEAPAPPEDAAGVAELIGAAGHEAELARARDGWSLDIVQRA